MARQLYEVLENLIRAKYTRSRRAILDQVNLDLEILRFQIRLAKDQHCLSLKSYGMAAERLSLPILQLSHQVIPFLGCVNKRRYYETQHNR